VHWNYLAAWEFAKRKQGRAPPLFTIEKAIGDWKETRKERFADGASFDQIQGRK
jgi:ABC-type sulfate transport system substrate-binding protein